MTAAGHETFMGDLLRLAEVYWWLLLIFGGSILGAIGAFFDGARNFVLEWGDRRHQRRLDVIRARHGLPASPGAHGEEKVTPGPCPHRPKNLRAVIGPDGKHLSWLCTACDAQLPASFAVLADDL